MNYSGLSKSLFQGARPTSTGLLKICILMLLLFNVSLSAAESSILIRDSRTGQSKTLINSTEINRFNYYWSQRSQRGGKQQYQWRYQLIINDKSGESRWVYDTDGYLREITMGDVSPIYQLTPIRAFNRFLAKE